MTTRYLHTSELGFYFTLGNVFSKDGDYASDAAYFEQCQGPILQALCALPFWKQTDDANGPMQSSPYTLHAFDPEFEVFDNTIVFSIWVTSERVAIFPKYHAAGMKDAMMSVMSATFVKAQTYQEWRETVNTDVTF